MSVLLPAPFSPMSAWTSPRRTVKSTSSKARTPGKLFDSLRISSSAADSLPMRWIEANRSILALRQLSRRLGLLVNALFDDGSFRQFLFRHNRIDSIEQLRPDEWIAFDGAIQF